MADTADLSSLNKGISELNKNLKYLTGANLFNNAKMNEMVNASDKIRDNFEDIDDFTNDIVKKSKEEETRLKAINAIEKKRLDIKKVEREIDEKTNKIKKNGLELAERQKKLINRINKDEIEKTENLKKQTLELADQRKELKMHKAELEANLKTSEEQTKEFEKQLSLQKQQKSILSSLGSDFKRLGGNIKNLASGVVGKFLSAGMFIEGWKNLYDMSNKVYDSYWKLSVPLQKANTGMFALKAKTEEYSKALREVKFTAAKFGYDIDKIEPMINTLQDKVKYLKKDVGGKWEWDIESLADNAKQIISISKMMNMESDEMITMLEERVRRFGDTNEAALNSMHEMAAATLTFNEIMGQGSVFTEEVGKHLLELHQNTKYWVQDFGMLNTMFNSHVNLLLKQGKHQKEALALARQFQEGLQQPPELIKWKAGTRMLSEIKSKIKNLSDEDAAAQIKAMYGDNVDADAIVKAIRHSKNTGFTIANILQEMLGGTKEGTAATMGAWKSFMGFDSTVLKDMGLASSVSDAEKIKQLYKDLYKMGLGPNTTMEDAINKLVDTDKKLSEEEKEAKKKELKELINVNKGEAGKEPMSPFENGVLEIMKDLKAWLDTPMVQIAGGMLAGGAGIFKDTLSTALGMLLATRGGQMLRSGKALVGRGIDAAGHFKDVASTNAGRLKYLESVRAESKSTIDAISKGKYKGANPAKALSEATGRFEKSSALLKSGSMKSARSLRSFARFAKGGLVGAGVALLSSVAGAGANEWDDESIRRRELERNDVVSQKLTSLDLIKQGYANSIEEAVAIQSKYAKDGTASMSQIMKSGFKMLEGATSLAFAPLSAGISTLIGAASSFVNETSIVQGALAGYEDTFAGFAEGVVGFLADVTDSDGLKKAANAISNFRKELGYLTGNLQVGKAGATAKAIERAERMATSVYGGKAVSAMDTASLMELGMSSADINKFLGSFDMGKALTSERKIKTAGWFGNKTQEEYLKSKGLLTGNAQSDAQMNLLYASARNIAKARVQSTLSDYTEKDIESEAQAVLEEMLAKQEENARQQQAELKKQVDLEQDMAEYDKKIMENSKTQSDYLNILSQKAALDMVADKGRYSSAFKEVQQSWKGRLKNEGGKWTIDNVPTSIAGAVSTAVFGA